MRGHYYVCVGFAGGIVVRVHLTGASPVTSYWRPVNVCNPYIGTNGERRCEPELKVEVTVYTENVDKTIEVVKAVQPYEEPVINVIPLWRTSF